eukprot:CAMPEP_0196571658 /NCGR_PEP_ID=MMETSP1081-20130531/1807_1 /TAXON_ID=36882 /ORGANISM="Pyramimonas amylifera, Strain CCMP720" /LENGTH=177 /DNA_ID=CAMNT_0041888687 /DNA_START=35 /DNA_END=568 /DNA_ORIENTATION=-
MGREGEQREEYRQRRDYGAPEEQFHRGSAGLPGPREDNRGGRPQSAHQQERDQHQQCREHDREGRQEYEGARNYQEMPPAGARHQMRPASATAAPFAHHPQDARFKTASREQADALRHARYEPPQFGRKRCDDIGITGPNLRDAGGSRGAGAAGNRGGSSIATSTTATNIFATGYHS